MTSLMFLIESTDPPLVPFPHVAPSIPQPAFWQAVSRGAVFFRRLRPAALAAA